MKKTLKLALILGIAFPVFAIAQVAEPIQSPSSDSLEQSSTGGPTPAMVAEMKKLEAEQAKLQTPPAPSTDSSAGIAVPPPSIEDKVGMLSYAVSLIFVWLIGLTAFMLKGAKK